MSKELVILGLGSNMGERKHALDRACEILRGLLDGMRVSSRMETPALLPPGAPPEWDMPYMNMAVCGTTSLTPLQLLEEVKKIEQLLGRQARGHWGPREIDIDILAYGQQVITADGLCIPHKELLNREFALLPLAEVAPGWVYPTGAHKGRTAQYLAKTLFLPRTRLVGIINLTPDSFSDGGRYRDAAAAIAHAEQLVVEGASVIDVGAESTRPGAAPVSPQEEWARLAPVLPDLCQQNMAVSVDTRHAATAQKALAAGAQWINDVSGLTDANMIATVKDSDCRMVVMHSLTVPADKHVTLPMEADVMQTLLAWGRATLIRLQEAGIAKERIILDPGIGFGKTAEQSREILEKAGQLKTLGVPMMIGHSRKSFLGDGKDRDAATLDVSKHLIGKVDYLRVHDVAAHAALVKAGRYGS